MFRGTNVTIKHFRDSERKHFRTRKKKILLRHCVIGTDVTAIKHDTHAHSHCLCRLWLKMDVEELIESIIRAIMFLAGILGNSWLLLRSLPASRAAVRTNEVLFINLALSNFITNFLVDLPDTIADVAGRWFLGETFCGVFRFSADLSETSSIYTTFIISTFWYQKLVGSLKRGGAPVRLDSLGLVGVLLAGSWTVALTFSIPHFFFVAVEASNDSLEDCIDVFPNAMAHQTYEILYLSFANAVPVVGIVFTSVQIIITLMQNHKRIQDHRTEKGGALAGGAAPSGYPAPSAVTLRPRQNVAHHLRAAKSVVAVAIVFLVCWLTHLLLRVKNSIKTAPMIVEVASYIAASYTCIIPYIFLHGVKKLTCSCAR